MVVSTFRENAFPRFRLYLCANLWRVCLFDRQSVGGSTVFLYLLGLGLYIFDSLSFYASLGLSCYNLLSCFWISLFLCLLVFCLSVLWPSLSICLYLSIYDHNGLFWLSVCLSMVSLVLSDCPRVSLFVVGSSISGCLRSVAQSDIPRLLFQLFSIGFLPFQSNSVPGCHWLDNRNETNERCQTEKSRRKKIGNWCWFRSLEANLLTLISLVTRKELFMARLY